LIDATVVGDLQSNPDLGVTRMVFIDNRADKAARGLASSRRAQA
jgi:hypothetical protein